MLRLETDTYLLEDVHEDAPIHRAMVTVDRELGGVIGFELVVESDGSLLKAAPLDWLNEIERRLRGLSEVKSLIGPHTLLREAAGTVGLDLTPALAPAVLAAVKSRGGAETAGRLLAQDERQARIDVRVGDIGTRRGEIVRAKCLEMARESAPEGVSVRVAGLTVQAEKVLDRLIREMAKSTVLAFGGIFLLMAVLFRSVKVGALAMVPNMFPLVAAAGFMGFAGITVRSSIALIFAVALGIAVDDTIHMIARYRRERAAGRSRRTATALSVRRTGRPVVLTSIVLLAGFLSFTISDFKATNHFGLVASVTIVTALIGDLLLLPGLWLLRSKVSAAGRASPERAPGGA
jgi:predicted RND superfamily exporter protein